MPDISCSKNVFVNKNFVSMQCSHIYCAVFCIMTLLKINSVLLVHNFSFFNSSSLLILLLTNKENLKERLLRSSEDILYTTMRKTNGFLTQWVWKCTYCISHDGFLKSVFSFSTHPVASQPDVFLWPHFLLVNQLHHM